jgi:hypothetical protein
MPRFIKIAIRAVGIVNTILVLLGMWFLADSIRFILTGYTADHPNIPYLRFALVAMTFINVSFLAILLVTAVRFIQGKIYSVNTYSLAVLVLVAYDYTTRALWHWKKVGISVAAATGIGNMGVAPFEFCFFVPFLYPVGSVVLLQIVKQLYATAYPAATAGQPSLYGGVAERS